MVPEAIWLCMRAVTNGLSTGGSIALALKLLSWVEKDQLVNLRSFSLPTWGLDWPSYLLGIFTGIFLVVAIEAWCTFKWCLQRWIERPQYCERPALPRQPKPLYKLC